jgi:hypothetical protein
VIEKNVSKNTNENNSMTYSEVVACENKHVSFTQDMKLQKKAINQVVIKKNGDIILLN